MLETIINICRSSAIALSLASCSVAIASGDVFPDPHETAPPATLALPLGYTEEDALIALPGLGRVHTVKLSEPQSKTTIVYAGHNASFVARQTEVVAHIAQATGADIVLFDYPGRGGTELPTGFSSITPFGAAFVKALKSKGWIDVKPTYIYGVSFGGAEAASIARTGNVRGLILEGSMTDINALGRNATPFLLKPFVEIKVDPRFYDFDYIDSIVDAKTPVLLISSEQDSVVRTDDMRTLAALLRLRGVKTTLVTVPGTHATALRQPLALGAIAKFTSQPTME